MYDSYHCQLLQQPQSHLCHTLNKISCQVLGECKMNETVCQRTNDTSGFGCETFLLNSQQHPAVHYAAERVWSINTTATLSTEEESDDGNCLAATAFEHAAPAQNAVGGLNATARAHSLGVRVSRWTGIRTEAGDESAQMATHKNLSWPKSRQTTDPSELPLRRTSYVSARAVTVSRLVTENDLIHDFVSKWRLWGGRKKIVKLKINFNL